MLYLDIKKYIKNWLIYKYIKLYYKYKYNLLDFLSILHCY